MFAAQEAPVPYATRHEPVYIPCVISHPLTEESLGRGVGMFAKACADTFSHSPSINRNRNIPQLPQMNPQLEEPLVVVSTSGPVGLPGCGPLLLVLHNYRTDAPMHHTPWWKWENGESERFL